MLYSYSEGPEPGYVGRMGWMRRKSFPIRVMPGGRNKWTHNSTSAEYTAASLHLCIL